MKKIIIVIVVLVVGGIFFIGKGGSDMKSLDSAPIKIGFVGPLTGDVSSLGIPASKAVELAVQEFNKNGGVGGRPVQLIMEDGACNSKTATNAGNKLINADKVFAIVGGACSGETSAFGSLAMQNKIVTISYLSSSPALSKLGKYFFRTFPSDTFQGKYAAEYMYNGLGVKKVAIVYGNNDYGTGVSEVFSNRFKELGGEVVLFEGVSQDNRDYRTVISKIKSSGAEGLYAVTYTDGSVAFLNQIKDTGLKIKVLGADAWADTKFQQDVPSQVGALYLEAKTKDSKEFYDSFTKAYPELKIGAGTSQAYDATRILLSAIQTVGLDSDKVAQEIRSKTHEGVSGRISFDGNGDMKEANYQIKKLLGNGKVEEVK
jgi:branched-chain amino acid transport system substrate-binding protein